MIIVGSYAAYLRGDLPAWRAGRHFDIDVWGTRDECASVIDRLDRPAVWHRGERTMVARSALRIDIDHEDAAYRRAMPVLEGSVSVFGVDARIITLPGQRAISLAMQATPWAREKHALDLKEWGEEPRDERLFDLARAYLNSKPVT